MGGAGMSRHDVVHGLLGVFGGTALILGIIWAGRDALTLFILGLGGLVLVAAGFVFGIAIGSFHE